MLPQQWAANCIPFRNYSWYKDTFTIKGEGIAKVRDGLPARELTATRLNPGRAVD